MHKNTRPFSDIHKAQQWLQSGQISAAKELLTKTCAIDKNNVEAWFHLSAANGQLGLFDDVIKCCKQIIKIRPETGPAYVNMGNALAALGRHEESTKCYRKALKIQPDDPTTLNNYGHALFLAGKHSASVSTLRKAITLKPEYVVAHHNLANALETTGELKQAFYHYHEALRINPDFAESHFKLGDYLRERGDLDAAEDSYRKALEICPGSPETLKRFAILLRYQGKLDEALKVYKQLSTIPSEEYSATAGMADIYERKNDIDSAHEQVTYLLEKDCLDATLACTYTRICRKFNTCDEAIRLCKNILHNTSTKIGEKQMVHYALGSLLDKLGKYDSAFKHFHHANTILTTIFNQDEQKNKFDRLIKAFSKNAMDPLPRATNTSNRPVFIIGMPRSGTSLVEQILSSHPDVYAAGELGDISRIVMSISSILAKDTSYPECIKLLDNEFLDKLAEQYLNKLASLSGSALHITDKMPHNFLHLGAIALMLPNAKIIHCTRNPLDTCLSIYFQSFNRMHDYATDLENLGIFYKHYHRLMSHWKQVVDLPLLEVKYENMVTDQERTSRSLVEFTGLDWDERCLQFHETKRTVATASYDQVRTPIYTKSIGRWKNYERHIGILRSALEDLD